MGLMSSLPGMGGGGGGNAAKNAAFETRLAAEKAGSQLYKSKAYSRDRLRQGYDAAQNQLQPGSTAGGYASSLADIMGGEGFQPIINQNRRNLEAELSQQGLTRSGSGITQMSQVPLNTAMQIEQGLYGRKGGLADLMVGRSSNLAGLETNYGQNLASIYTGQGQDQSSALLAGQQAAAGGQTNQANMMGGAMNMMGSMFGGMGGE